MAADNRLCRSTRTSRGSAAKIENSNEIFLLIFNHCASKLILIS